MVVLIISINYPKLVGYKHAKASISRFLVRQPKSADETTYAPTNSLTTSSSSISSIVFGMIHDLNKRVLLENFN
jgi:hypothetical protein